MEHHKFGKRSLYHLSQVHPTLVAMAHEILYSSPNDLGISDGVRTEAEQKENVTKGVSWTMNSKHRLRRFEGIDTPLAGAFDFFIIVNGKSVWNAKPYEELRGIIMDSADILNTEIVWGADWDSKDYPHIELAEESVLWEQ